MSRVIRVSIHFCLLAIASICGAQDTSTSLIWFYVTQRPLAAVAGIADVDANGFADVLAGGADSTVYCLQGHGVNAGTPIWTYKTGGAILSLAVIGDVNNDDIEDCLVGSTDDYLYCLSGKPAETTRVLWSVALGGDVSVVKAFSDVNADGVPDCLIGTVNKRILCMSGAGAVIWQGVVGGEVKAIAATTDIDGDTWPDCFVGSSDKMIYCFSGIGKNGGKSTLMGRNVNADIYAVASIPDVDGDGKADCVIATSAKTIECRQSYLTGNVNWVYTVQGSVRCLTVVDDINEDGFPDVVAGSDDNNVYAIDGNSTELLWTALFADDILALVAIADVSKDNKNEIIVGAADNRIVCLGGGGAKAGKELWSFTAGDDVHALGILPDVRGNGIPEVIAGSNDHIVRVLEGNAMILDVELSSFQAVRQTEGVLLNWQTATETRNLGFNVQYSTDAANWITVQFIPGHGTTGTGQAYEYLHQCESNGSLYYRLQQIDSDGRINFSPMLTVTIKPPSVFRLAGNYPNPFNNGTFIKYALPQTGMVRIELYNLHGEMIRSWKPGQQAAGSYSVHWNGLMDNGRSAVSGVFYYIVHWQDEIKTGKMTLLK